MDETIGLTTLPSVNDRTLTSGPSRNSSITTVSPLAPNFLSSMIVRSPTLASSRVSAIITPLPSASPSALITVGIGQVSMYFRAASISSKISYDAVGIPYFFMSRLEKALLPSMRAAALSGPKQGMPFSSSMSTRPSTSGSSGATTT